MSLFVIYFGLKKPTPKALKHHVILFGKRYKELIAEIFGKGGKLSDDFSLYLHAPGAKKTTDHFLLFNCSIKSLSL